MEKIKELLAVIRKEGDSKTFIHKDFECRIYRTKTIGHLCGYIRIPSTHKFYRKPKKVEDLNVHGGITYVSHELRGELGWWVGFDCGHYCDISPHLTEITGIVFGEYRTMEYVTKELHKLVEQLF
jgi:hypothetical protein